MHPNLTNRQTKGLLRSTQPSTSSSAAATRYRQPSQPPSVLSPPVPCEARTGPGHAASSPTAHHGAVRGPPPPPNINPISRPGDPLRALEDSRYLEDEVSWQLLVNKRACLFIYTTRSTLSHLQGRGHGNFLRRHGNLTNNETWGTNGAGQLSSKLEQRRATSPRRCVGKDSNLVCAPLIDRRAEPRWTRPAGPRQAHTRQLHDGPTPLLFRPQLLLGRHL
uniref:Uncharacterized protein n=1 Tax=Mycena chlorophos TaxID=658473 RepID=A0ABQ0LBS4_MYCCL|nr:predicted protein [Mycena chlorophos]